LKLLFENLIWKFCLKMLFENFVSIFCFKMLFQNSVSKFSFKFCLKTLFENSVWKCFLKIMLEILFANFYCNLNLMTWTKLDFDLTKFKCYKNFQNVTPHFQAVKQNFIILHFFSKFFQNVKKKYSKKQVLRWLSNI